MLTLTNTFHNTSVRTRYTEERLERLSKLYPQERTAAENATIRRLRRALCGIEGCTCAQDIFGQRS